MFLSNISVVDHAYIDSNGHIVGGSFNPSFIVDGEVDELEQVVIDFSTCKKDIKAIIDSKEFGMDHKLWVGEFSNVEVVAEDTGFRLTTPHWLIKVPKNALHFTTLQEYTTSSVGEYLQQFVEKHLRQTYPTVKLTVLNNTDAHTVNIPDLGPMAFFRYTHGLKNSTSWGCQNIAHGHLSYIRIASHDAIGAALVAQEIATTVDNTMFIWRENHTPHIKGDSVAYSTERGAFSLTMRSREPKIKLLSTETTIEHLVDVIAHVFATELRNIEATAIYVSEGLSKGAVHYIK